MFGKNVRWSARRKWQGIAFGVITLFMLEMYIGMTMLVPPVDAPKVATASDPTEFAFLNRTQILADEDGNLLFYANGSVYIIAEIGGPDVAWGGDMASFTFGEANCEEWEQTLYTCDTGLHAWALVLDDEMKLYNMSIPTTERERFASLSVQPIYIAQGEINPTRSTPVRVNFNASGDIAVLIWSLGNFSDLALSLDGAVLKGNDYGTNLGYSCMLVADAVFESEWIRFPARVSAGSHFLDISGEKNQTIYYTIVHGTGDFDDDQLLDYEEMTSTNTELSPQYSNAWGYATSFEGTEEKGTEDWTRKDLTIYIPDISTSEEKELMLKAYNGEFTNISIDGDASFFAGVTLYGYTGNGEYPVLILDSNEEEQGVYFARDIKAPDRAITEIVESGWHNVSYYIHEDPLIVPELVLYVDGQMIQFNSFSENSEVGIGEDGDMDGDTVPDDYDICPTATLTWRKNTLLQLTVPCDRSNGEDVQLQIDVMRKTTDPDPNELLLWHPDEQDGREICLLPLMILYGPGSSALTKGWEDYWNNLEQLQEFMNETNPWPVDTYNLIDVDANGNASISAITGDCDPLPQNGTNAYDYQMIFMPMLAENISEYTLWYSADHPAIQNDGFITLRCRWAIGVVEKSKADEDDSSLLGFYDYPDNVTISGIKVSFFSNVNGLLGEPRDTATHLACWFSNQNPQIAMDDDAEVDRAIVGSITGAHLIHQYNFDPADQGTWSAIERINQIRNQTPWDRQSAEVTYITQTTRTLDLLSKINQSIQFDLVTGEQYCEYPQQFDFTPISAGLLVDANDPVIPWWTAAAGAGQLSVARNVQTRANVLEIDAGSAGLTLQVDAGDSSGNGSVTFALYLPSIDTECEVRFGGTTTPNAFALVVEKDPEYSDRQMLKYRAAEGALEEICEVWPNEWFSFEVWFDNNTDPWSDTEIGTWDIFMDGAMQCAAMELPAWNAWETIRYVDFVISASDCVNLDFAGIYLGEFGASDAGPYMSCEMVHYGDARERSSFFTVSDIYNGTFAPGDPELAGNEMTLWTAEYSSWQHYMERAVVYSWPMNLQLRRVYADIIDGFSMKQFLNVSFAEATNIPAGDLPELAGSSFTWHSRDVPIIALFRHLLVSEMVDPAPDEEGPATVCFRLGDHAWWETDWRVGEVDPWVEYCTRHSAPWIDILVLADLFDAFYNLHRLWKFCIQWRYNITQGILPPFSNNVYFPFLTRNVVQKNQDLQTVPVDQSQYAPASALPGELLNFVKETYSQDTIVQWLDTFLTDYDKLLKIILTEEGTVLPILRTVEINYTTQEARNKLQQWAVANSMTAYFTNGVPNGRLPDEVSTQIPESCLIIYPGGWVPKAFTQEGVFGDVHNFWIREVHVGISKSDKIDAIRTFATAVRLLLEWRIIAPWGPTQGTFLQYGSFYGYLDPNTGAIGQVGDSVTVAGINGIVLPKPTCWDERMQRWEVNLHDLYPQLPENCWITLTNGDRVYVEHWMYNISFYKTGPLADNEWHSDCLSVNCDYQRLLGALALQQINELIGLTALDKVETIASEDKSSRAKWTHLRTDNYYIPPEYKVMIKELHNIRRDLGKTAKAATEYTSCSDAQWHNEQKNNGLHDIAEAIRKNIIPTTALKAISSIIPYCRTRLFTRFRGNWNDFLRLAFQFSYLQSAPITEKQTQSAAAMFDADNTLIEFINDLFEIIRKNRGYRNLNYLIPDIIEALEEILGNEETVRKWVEEKLKNLKLITMYRGRIAAFSVKLILEIILVYGFNIEPDIVKKVLQLKPKTTNIPGLQRKGENKYLANKESTPATNDRHLKKFKFRLTEIDLTGKSNVKMAELTFSEVCEMLKNLYVPRHPLTEWEEEEIIEEAWQRALSATNPEAGLYGTQSFFERVRGGLETNIALQFTFGTASLFGAETALDVVELATGAYPGIAIPAGGIVPAYLFSYGSGCGIRMGISATKATMNPKYLPLQPKYLDAYKIHCITAEEYNSGSIGTKLADIAEKTSESSAQKAARIMYKLAIVLTAVLLIYSAFELWEDYKNGAPIQIIIGDALNVASLSLTLLAMIGQALISAGLIAAGALTTAIAAISWLAWILTAVLIVYLICLWAYTMRLNYLLTYETRISVNLNSTIMSPALVRHGGLFVGDELTMKMSVNNSGYMEWSRYGGVLSFFTTSGAPFWFRSRYALGNTTQLGSWSSPEAGPWPGPWSGGAFDYLTWEPGTNIGDLLLPEFKFQHENNWETSTRSPLYTYDMTAHADFATSYLAYEMQYQFASTYQGRTEHDVETTARTIFGDLNGDGWIDPCYESSVPVLESTLTAFLARSEVVTAEPIMEEYKTAFDTACTNYQWLDASECASDLLGLAADTIVLPELLFNQTIARLENLTGENANQTWKNYGATEFVVNQSLPQDVVENYYLFQTANQTEFNSWFNGTYGQALIAAGWRPARPAWNQFSSTQVVYLNSYDLTNPAGQILIPIEWVENARDAYAYQKTYADAVARLPCQTNIFATASWEEGALPVEAGGSASGAVQFLYEGSSNPLVTYTFTPPAGWGISITSGCLSVASGTIPLKELVWAPFTVTAPLGTPAGTYYITFEEVLADGSINAGNVTYACLIPVRVCYSDNWTLDVVGLPSVANPGTTYTWATLDNDGTIAHTLYITGDGVPVEWLTADGFAPIASWSFTGPTSDWTCAGTSSATFQDPTYYSYIAGYDGDIGLVAEDRVISEIPQLQNTTFEVITPTTPWAGATNLTLGIEFTNATTGEAGATVALAPANASGAITGPPVWQKEIASLPIDTPQLIGIPEAGRFVLYVSSGHGLVQAIAYGSYPEQYTPSGMHWYVNGNYPPGWVPWDMYSYPKVATGNGALTLQSEAEETVTAVVNLSTTLNPGDRIHVIYKNDGATNSMLSAWADFALAGNGWQEQTFVADDFYVLAQINISALVEPRINSEAGTFSVYHLSVDRALTRHAPLTEFVFSGDTANIAEAGWSATFGSGQSSIWVTAPVTNAVTASAASPDANFNDAANRDVLAVSFANATAYFEVPLVDDIIGATGYQTFGSAQRYLTARHLTLTGSEDSFQLYECEAFNETTLTYNARPAVIWGPISNMSAGASSDTFDLSWALGRYFCANSSQSADSVAFYGDEAAANGPTVTVGVAKAGVAGGSLVLQSGTSETFQVVRDLAEGGQNVTLATGDRVWATFESTLSSSVTLTLANADPSGDDLVFTLATPADQNQGLISRQYIVPSGGNFTTLTISGTLAAMQNFSLSFAGLYRYLPLGAPLVSADIGGFYPQTIAPEEFTSEAYSSAIDFNEFADFGEYGGQYQFKDFTDWGTDANTEIVANFNGHRNVAHVWATGDSWDYFSNPNIGSVVGGNVEFWVYLTGSSWLAFGLGACGFLGFNGASSYVSWYKGDWSGETPLAPYAQDEWINVREELNGNNVSVWLNGVLIGRSLPASLDYFNYLYYAHGTSLDFYLDSVDGSWAPGYYVGRSQDFANIPEVNSYHTHSQVRSNLTVMPSLLGHQNVLNATNIQIVDDWFAPQITGTVETWFYLPSTGNNNTLYIALMDTWSAFNYIAVLANGQVRNINPGWVGDTFLTTISLDAWHHFRIAFNVTAGTTGKVSVWVDGTQYGNDLDVGWNVTSVNRFGFFSGDNYQLNRYCVDAIDYSWSAGFVQGRNQICHAPTVLTEVAGHRDALALVNSESSGGAANYTFPGAQTQGRLDFLVYAPGTNETFAMLLEAASGSGIQLTVADWQLWCSNTSGAVAPASVYGGWHAYSVAWDCTTGNYTVWSANQTVIAVNFTTGAGALHFSGTAITGVQFVTNANRSAYYLDGVCLAPEATWPSNQSLVETFRSGAGAYLVMGAGEEWNLLCTPTGFDTYEDVHLAIYAAGTSQLAGLAHQDVVVNIAPAATHCDPVSYLTSVENDEQVSWTIMDGGEVNTNATWEVRRDGVVADSDAWTSGPVNVTVPTANEVPGTYNYSLWVTDGYTNLQLLDWTLVTALNSLPNATGCANYSYATYAELGKYVYWTLADAGAIGFNASWQVFLGSTLVNSGPWGESGDLAYALTQNQDPGSYIYTLKVDDGYTGLQSKGTAIQVTATNAAPASSSPADATYWTCRENITVTWTLNDTGIKTGAGQYEVYRNDTTLVKSGSFTTNGQSVSVVPGNLVPATYILSIRTTDGMSGWLWLDNVTVKANNTLPNVNDVGNFNYSTYEDNTRQIVWTITDLGYITASARYAVRLNGGVILDQEWDTNGKVVSIPVYEQMPGTYTYTINVTDGHSSYSTLDTVTVSAYNVLATSNSPSDIAHNDSAMECATISWTITDLGVVGGIGTWQVRNGSTVNASGTWDEGQDTVAFTAYTNKPGITYFALWVNDGMSGFICLDTVMLNVTDDDTAGPIITITYVGSGYDYNPGYWNVNASDASGIGNVSVFIDGSHVGSTLGNYNVLLVDPDCYPTHTISVTVLDGDVDLGPSDRMSSTSISSQKITDDDMVAPVVTITHLDFHWWVAYWYTEIYFTIYDASGVYDATILWSDGVTSYFSSPGSADGTYTLTTYRAWMNVGVAWIDVWSYDYDRGSLDREFKRQL